MRVKHLSVRTEEAYLGWMRRFYEFHGRKDPATLGAVELSAFLSSLATERKVAASTQNQALAALLFLYRSVLGLEFPWLDDLVRARGPARLPVVLSRDEVRAVLSSSGWVALPDALARKLPSAGREWPWQWVFPATRGYADRETGQHRRHHLHETVVQQAVRRAVLASGIAKRATCHTFRHSFATHLLEDGSGHPHCAGAARAQGRGDDDDLHARAESRSGRRPEPRPIDSCRVSPGGRGGSGDVRSVAHGMVD